MAKQAILVVEDENEIRELISYNLLREGYQVAGVATGREALEFIESRPIDLVLLDLMLPDVDAFALCRRLKGDPKTASIPIIIVSALGQESDIVNGLSLGAEDYVTKPFSPRVLLARVRAVFRRMSAPDARTGGRSPSDSGTRIHDLEIIPGRHEVLYQGRPIELSTTEFRVLMLLASKPGWVFTRPQILDGVHGENCPVTDRAVDVQIVGLRKRLGPAGKYIETVRGVGYRLRD